MPSGRPVSIGARGRIRQIVTTTFIASLVVLFVVSIAAALVASAQVWLLVFVGLLFALLLSTAAGGVQHLTGLSWRGALLVSVVTLVAVLVGVGSALWPAVAEQVGELAVQLPAAVANLREWVAAQPWGPWLLGQAGPEQLVANDAVLGEAAGAVVASVGFVIAVLVVTVVGLYVAAEPGIYQRGLRHLVPAAGRARMDAMLPEVVNVLRWWLLGTLCSMTLVGLLTTVGLWWLDVPLALTFGLLAALLAFIPNVGPVLSVVPPLLIAFTVSANTALAVVLLYGAIQLVESYAVTPLIQRRTVLLPPALTITAQLVLGTIAGALGLLVATPLTAAVVTVIRTWDSAEGGDPPRPDLGG